ncbi:gypsy retrotransposon integrase-like protein 1 [Hydra vulgaris]|uniref:gypsy retrotransposon integrase-like protein 1 n=1 Tax=Hydra vulgaris TaxID=6087 RepID=UPI0032E9DE81
MDEQKSNYEEMMLADVSNYLSKSVYRHDCTLNDKRTIRRKAKRFRMEDNKLHRKTKKDLWLEVVFSKAQRKQIVNSCHSEPTAGHLGRTRTFYKVAERFYWPGIFKDVENAVKNCEQCQHTNIRRFEKTCPELHPIKVQSPWFHIGIDLIGPLPETSAGNKHILTISDYCTNWVAAFPLKSKLASGVAIALYKLFMQMGIPKVVTSDQGTEFYNQINRELMSLLNVKHQFTTAYHPQANGLDERFNQTIQLMLVKFCNDRHSTWDTHLDACTFAYNTSRQESIKYTPFELMFGRKPILPIEFEVAGESPESLLFDFNARPESSQHFMNKIIEERYKAFIGLIKNNCSFFLFFFSFW